ncbi:MAG: type I-B CRISPR-associated protein Cas5b [Clostridium sp.]|jgi:CRISPR-associated protein Cas5h|uniref:type I-B CRISPR-associated protein Cas5b n=1 Tax=Clostridium sp. TaxID=1506 RepID=UPI0025C255C2|nr:type I-B CRISPR-associated protein Cas5b [Clostridium sp.]MCH3963142.1 type I-B CRISPR-associated protein Cas5b [Clostridium sp.]MCI1716395.1 type I-B CRISPR-associated protein Cas5b [Clostridium sp.]MCI1800735.1 type I-B CRISPR-associated protein Cas5b [Clostridium sp.]MCI1814610.1 type I-B CRISPR-associated protein Cas5b [Clostridium sp.]MCI1871520.1 type I-B CRISPR-associated protein Cas5b [Clostridium sp.]
MKVVRFKLSGKTAFFKKPDVNTYYYFTYGNIHKIALLGIIGSVLGLGGYNVQSRDFKNNIYPEFYEKLKDSKIAVVPLNTHGYITKKVQTFNNSVGYASLEAGGNLVVKEQWLQNPKWMVYVIIDEITKKFADMLMHKKAVFLPYLGKNDHFADITEVKKTEILKTEDYNKIDSLFESKYFHINKYPNEEDDTAWKYAEYLPAELGSKLNQYKFEYFVATNMDVKSKKKDISVYKDLETKYNLCFF